MGESNARPMDEHPTDRTQKRPAAARLRHRSVRHLSTWETAAVAVSRLDNSGPAPALVISPSTARAPLNSYVRQAGAPAPSARQLGAVDELPVLLGPSLVGPESLPLPDARLPPDPEPPGLAPTRETSLFASSSVVRLPHAAATQRTHARKLGHLWRMVVHSLGSALPHRSGRKADDDSVCRSRSLGNANFSYSPRGGTHGLVFVDDAGVLHGHLPSCEWDEAGVPRDVLAVERGTTE